MTRQSNCSTSLTELVPNLRAFARSLSGNSDQADDLVQETLIKAWRYRSSFTRALNSRRGCSPFSAIRICLTAAAQKRN